jgi:hypothetical protein
MVISPFFPIYCTPSFLHLICLFYIWNLSTWKTLLILLQIFGAVQQENRVSKAIEVMLTHVENLKRMYEKEHTELEETK